MQHNEYKLPDGRVLRILNDDILVKMDPLRETTSGGIVIPDTVGDRGDAGILATGTVLAYGFAHTKTRPRPPIGGLKAGDKIVFIRFLKEQETNKQLHTRFGDADIFKLKESSIIVVYDPEDHDRVLK